MIQAIYWEKVRLLHLQLLHMGFLNLWSVNRWLNDHSAHCCTDTIFFESDWQHYMENSIAEEKHFSVYLYYLHWLRAAKTRRFDWFIKRRANAIQQWKSWILIDYAVRADILKDYLEPLPGDCREKRKCVAVEIAENGFEIVWKIYWWLSHN